MDPAAEGVEELHRKYYAKVWRYIRHRVDGVDTEPIAADVFVTAWQHLGKIPAGSELPWLITVAEWKVRNAVRTKRKHAKNVTAARETIDPEAVYPAVERDSLATIIYEDALRTLKEDERRLLVLVVLEFSASEIADILGCKRTTASMRITRLQAKLAAWYGDQSRDDDEDPEARSVEGRKP
jgi:RNA polymerase sigma-70 factor (ECF subfamily)